LVYLKFNGMSEMLHKFLTLLSYLIEKKICFIIEKLLYIFIQLKNKKALNNLLFIDLEFSNKGYSLIR
jgi:hypothetical protein